MTTYANVGHLLLKRGNTTQSAGYTGPLGELVVDTGLKTVRVQDGVTPGGMAVLATLSGYNQLSGNIANLQTTTANISANLSAFQTYANTTTANLSANLSAFQTYANVTFGTSNFGNANVASYLSTSSIVTDINANVTAANLQIANLWSNAGVQADTIAILTANAGVQADAIVGANAAIVTANTALKGYVDTQLSTLTNGASTALDTLLEIGNALGNNANFSGVMVTWLGNITANITAANTNISTLQANVGSYYTWANANVAGLSTSISNLQSNAGVQADAITSLQANITAANLAIAAASGTYSNTNVAAYLSASTTGNVGAGNLTVINNFNSNIISANSFTYANGTSILAGIGGTYSNSNVSAYLSNYDGGINFTASPAVITGLGNISSANFTFGNGVNILSTIAPSSSYSDSNVASYLALGTDATIIGLVGNTTASNAAIVTANTAMKSYVDAGNTTMTSYVGNQVVTANTALKAYVDTQDSAITAAWTAANTVQSGQIATLQGQVYANSNVVSYLTANPIAYSSLTGRPSLATVATTGSYTDLINQPSIPSIAGLATTSYVDAVSTAWTAANTIQSNQIAGANAAIVTANSAVVSYVNTLTNSLATGANANTLAYLNSGFTVSGNITAGNISDVNIISANSVQLTSNLTVSGVGTVGGNLYVLGNLQVSGTTTTVSQATLSVTDKIITVSNGSTTGSQANGAGISVAGANANLYYTSIGDQWNTNKPFYAPGIYDGAARVVSTSSGAGNLTISGTSVNLTSVGPGAVTTGSATAIPVITTDAYGRISAITTAAVSSTLNTAGNTGTGTVSLTSQSLSVTGTNGITATASGQTITITDNLWPAANANLGTATTNITALQANLGGYYAWANANVAGLSSQIVGANAAIVTANTALKGYTDNQISTANTAVVNYVNTRTNSLATGANTNTAAYLAAGISTNITSTGTITGGNLSANNANITNYLYVGSAVTNLYKTVPLTVTGANAGNTITGINIVNTGGGGGSGSGIDFYTYTGAGYPPEASIYSVDNADYSANINFATKVPGAGANILAIRMTVGSNGNVVIPGNLNVGNVIVNGQPTTYGYVNGAYLLAQNNVDQSAGQNVAINFQTTSASNGSIINKISNTQVTLTAGNTYKLEGIVRRLQSSSTWAQFRWYDVTNSAYIGTEGFSEVVTSGNPIGSTIVATAYVTPSVNNTYELRQTTTNTITVSGNFATIEITQVNPTIAVQATATGTINNQYVNVTNAADQTVYATGTDIIWDTLSTSSGIAYSTSNGQFTLTAGSTYNIVGMFSFASYSTNGYLIVQLVDATTNAAIGNQQISFPYNTGYNEVNNTSLDIIYTPGTNQTVKFRVTGGTSGLNAKHRGGYFSRAAITQINQAFALNTLATMATTGDVSVGGNLAVIGNIAGTAVKITAPTFQAVTPSWGLGDAAIAAWFLLGTWNTSNAGNLLYMRLIAHTGYNAVATENQVTELTFATANGTSYITGSSGNFYGNGLASVNSRLGTGGTSPSYKAPNKFRIVQVSQTQYQIYAYFSAAYMRNSNYSIQISPGDTWVDGGGSGTVSAPGGNYIDITPSSF